MNVNYDVYAWWRSFALASLVFMLVILVFFIAVMPILPIRPYVDGAETRSFETAWEVESDAVITIARDGATFHENEIVTLPELRLRLAQKRYTAVRIRADRSTPFAAVRAVAIAARDAGYARITIMTKRPAQ